MSTTAIQLFSRNTSLIRQKRKGAKEKAKLQSELLSSSSTVEMGAKEFPQERCESSGVDKIALQLMIDLQIIAQIEQRLIDRMIMPPPTTDNEHVYLYGKKDDVVNGCIHLSERCMEFLQEHFSSPPQLEPSTLFLLTVQFPNLLSVMQKLFSFSEHLWRSASFIPMDVRTAAENIFLEQDQSLYIIQEVFYKIKQYLFKKIPYQNLRF